MPDDITSAQFMAAVQRSRLTTKEIARRLDVSRTTVYTYMANGVTRDSSIGHVRAAMGLWLRRPDGSPVEGFSDAELLQEIGRRLSELQTSSDSETPQRNRKS